MTMGCSVRTPRRRGSLITLFLCLAVLCPAAALGGGIAQASQVQYCAQIPGAAGSYARGHGDINLATNTVSGILCQVDRAAGRPDRLIIMTVQHHLIYHSHHAVMWGFPGNVMKITVRVQRSTDRHCKVGTIGHVTLFASYNGVRSDSVRFMFPASCKNHNRLYHGTQVNNQVPPL
jgi:hypothetical protein